MDDELKKETAADAEEMEKTVETAETVETVEAAEGTVEDPLDETQKEIDALKAQAAENLDRYQRCLAEFDNFRKRTAKEKAGMYDDGVKDTVEKLLCVVDNLERALAAQQNVEEAQNDPFVKGIEMTLKQFKEILQAMGVTEIAALGEKFDPNLHAAVAHEDNEDFGENEIMLEMLKGYKYKDKVIRHSMVKVAN